MANAVEIVIKALDATRGGFSSATKNIKNFQSAALAMGTVAATAAAAAATAYTALSKTFIDSADEIGKLTQKTGIASETLSRLKVVAEENGSSWEGVQKALRSAAEEASKTNQNFEQLLIGTADKFSQFSDGAGKAAEAQRIFGKEGANLIPILNKGSEGLKQALEEASQYTTVVDSKTAAAADEIGTNFSRIGKVIYKSFTETVKDALPYILKFSENVLQMTKALFDSEGPMKIVGGVLNFLAKSVAVTSQAYLGAIEVFQAFGEYMALELTGETKAGAEAFDDLGQKILDVEGKIKDLMNGKIKMPEVAAPKTTQMENPIDVEKYNKAYLEMGQIAAEGSMRVLNQISNEHSKRVESINDLMISEQAKNDFIAQSAAIANQQKIDLESKGILFLDDLEQAKHDGNIKRAMDLMQTEGANNAARIANNQAFIDVYTQQWQLASQNITGFVASMFGAFSQNFGNAIGEVLRDVGSAADAAKKFGQAMINSVTNFIGQWIAAKITMMAMELVFGRTVAAATVGTALTVGAAWAPAAALASLATLGSNSVAANAALASTVAFSKGLAVVGGVAHGGLDYVPQESTYLLDKGERVISPNQNAQLMEFLNGQGGGSGVVEVHLDGEVLGRGIGRLSRDGRMVISASSIA